MDKTYDCVFCKIAHHQIPSCVIYEDEFCIAFLDINPTTKGHTLVIPKEHYESFLSCPIEVVSRTMIVAQRIGQSLIKNLGANGVNILTNCGSAAGQEINHYHIHVIPRYDSDKRKLLSFSPYQIEMNEIKQIADSIKQDLNK